MENENKQTTETKGKKKATEPKKKFLTAEQRKEVADALQKRGVIQPCPRCGKSGFQVVDGYLSNVLQFDLKNLRLAGRTLPCAVVACVNCGYLMQHILGALDLLPQEENES